MSCMQYIFNLSGEVLRYLRRVIPTKISLINVGDDIFSLSHKLDALKEKVAEKRQIL